MRVGRNALNHVTLNFMGSIQLCLIKLIERGEAGRGEGGGGGGNGRLSMDVHAYQSVTRTNIPYLHNSTVTAISAGKQSILHRHYLQSDHGGRGSQTRSTMASLPM